MGNRSSTGKVQYSTVQQSTAHHHTVGPSIPGPPAASSILHPTNHRGGTQGTQPGGGRCGDEAARKMAVVVELAVPGS